MAHQETTGTGNNRLRAMLQSSKQKQNGGAVKIKFAIQFRKSGSTDECEDEIPDISAIEVTRSESEEMCADRVRLKDRILEGVSKAVKEVSAKVTEFGNLFLF